MADEPLRPDIQAAADRMTTKAGAKREIRKLMGYLWEGEAVTHMAAGAYGAGTGLVVLTDRRLLFVMDGWTQSKTEDFPLERISSVQWSTGTLLGTLTVFASGNKAEIKNMSKVDGKTIADTIRARLASQPAQAGPQYGAYPPAPPQQMAGHMPPPPPQPAAPMAPAAAGGQGLVTTPEQIYGALEQLGRLRDGGVLTPQEFEAKKAELLRRL